MIVQHASLLTPQQVRQVHEASLEILENVGLVVRYEAARSLLKKHGCSVDSQSLIVKFPRRVVEDFRTAIPPEFTFHGRDPRFDRTIPADGPLMMTGSSAPNIIDPVTGEEQRATSADLARIAHVVNELPAIDLFSVATLANDAPAGQFSLSRYYPALKNTVKPVRGNFPSLEETISVIQLGYAVAGSEAAYRERPLITHHYCPVVSPLTMDCASTEMLMYLTENDFPGYATVVPNAGLTSPLTLLGTLAQGNAEYLAWSTLQQIVKPGSPLIYSALPTVADMRTGAYAPGGIETGIMAMGFAQMGIYYKVPTAGYVGLTNSKETDVQAGYETGMSSVAGVLGGLDLINMAGLIDALMAFDYAKLAIDNEIAEMLRRIKRGLEFSQENLALDVIAEVGPGGMFVDTQHTLERMKSCAVLSRIADRDSRQTWLAKNSPSARSKALKRVRDILSRANPAAFSPDVDARVRGKFQDLVSGTSTLPTNWQDPPSA